MEDELTCRVSSYVVLRHWGQTSDFSEWAWSLEHQEEWQDGKGKAEGIVVVEMVVVVVLACFSSHQKSGL